MRLRQRAYLGVKSERLSPDDITTALGLAPTRVKVMGSRLIGDQPVPRANLWAFETNVPQAAPLDEHLAVVIAVIREHSENLRRLARAERTSVSIVIVRTFEEGAEDFDEAIYGVDPDSGFQRLSGQHPFLGWSLDSEVVTLLAACEISIDVDEYG